MSAESVVSHAPERSRYEISVEGVLAGFSVYVRSGDRVIFTHTEIGPEFGGQGLGSVLASGALSDVARAGLVVVPRCPFIAAYLRKHPDTDVAVEWPSD